MGYTEPTPDNIRIYVQDGQIYADMHGFDVYATRMAFPLGARPTLAQILHEFTSAQPDSA